MTVPDGERVALPPGGATTPDGQLLAGWWLRVAAALLDGLVLSGLQLAVLALVPDTGRAASVAVFAVVSLAYHAGFLLALQATPGKLLLGLRVRRRAARGRLPVSAVLARWVGWTGIPLALGWSPVVGAWAAGVYIAVDSLLPLWDPRWQAVHDKLAGTTVVRHGRWVSPT